MPDKHEDADSLISSIEHQMAFANLEKRGEYAVGIALMAGEVMKAALSNAVPYPLAREMAADFWKAEMLADTVAALIRDTDLNEDGDE